MKSVRSVVCCGQELESTALCNIAFDAGCKEYISKSKEKHTWNSLLRKEIAESWKKWLEDLPEELF
jgi:hypothetical protein